MENIRAFERDLPIAVIFGGMGAEHSVSLHTAYSIISSLERRGVPVLKIGITRDGAWYTYVGDTAAIPAGEWELGELAPTYPVRLGQRSGFLSGCDLVTAFAAFIALHGNFGEDGIVQGALTSAGIKYVGCGVSAGAVCSDKAYTKILAESIGIPTVPWVLYISRASGKKEGYGNVFANKTTAVSEAIKRLGFPMFVKPTCLGSSIGAGRANNIEELDRAIDTAALAGDGRVLIERAVNSVCELECAYLSVDGEEIYTEPGSIRTDGGFYDFSTKYEGCGKAIVSPTSDVRRDITRELCGYARELVALLGIRQLSRIDFLLDGDGKIYFNEINTFPGMTESSLYPELLRLVGVDFDRLIGILADGARL